MADYTHRIYFGEQLAAEVIFTDDQLAAAIQCIGVPLKIIFARGEQIEYWISGPQVKAIVSIPPAPAQLRTIRVSFNGAIEPPFEALDPQFEPQVRVLNAVYAKSREAGLTANEARARIEHMKDLPFNLEVIDG
jgi:hypothetical protein